MLDSGVDGPQAPDSEQGEGRDGSLVWPARLKDLWLEPRAHALATIHRAYNTDDADSLARRSQRWRRYIKASSTLAHERAWNSLQPAGERLLLIKPVGYLDTHVL